MEGFFGSLILLIIVCMIGVQAYEFTKLHKSFLDVVKFTLNQGIKIRDLELKIKEIEEEKEINKIFDKPIVEGVNLFSFNSEKTPEQIRQEIMDFLDDEEINNNNNKGE